MSEEEKMRKVDSLKSRMRNLNVIVKIVSKGEAREITSRRDGKVHSVAEALVGDETGCVLLSLWEDQISEFDESDVVEIRNGYTSLFKGYLRLNIGRHGIAEKVDKEMGQVNKENNLSEIKEFTYWRSSTTRPFRRRRRRY
jgi:replication factor A1